MMKADGESLQKREASQKFSISIIIPVDNGGEKFNRCLQELKRTAPAADEIIVVYDGEYHPSKEINRESVTKVLIMGAREGPAAARNMGAGHARGDILLFIDSDVIVHPDIIAHVEEAFENDNDLAAVFGSYDDTPAETNFLSQYKNLHHHFVHQMAREEASTFWSACGAVRREVFYAIGGFNEKYVYPSIEDIELGYRLKKNGYKIRLLKELQVGHLKKWSAVSLLRTDFFRRALPWTELIMSDGGFINDLNVRISSRISVILAYGIICTLMASFWENEFLFFTALSVLVLLFLNRKLYFFFYKKRGLRFAALSIPWHWFYFIYSGCAFLIGTVRHMFIKHKSWFKI